MLETGGLWLCLDEQVGEGGGREVVCEAGGGRFVAVVRLQQLLQLFFLPLKGSYLLLQVLLFGANLRIRGGKN